jgi:hypothetical protein
MVEYEEHFSGTMFLDFFVQLFMVYLSVSESGNRGPLRGCEAFFRGH